MPCAKIENENQYCIVADYLGTPTHAYNSAGEKIWEREIDCYGKTRKLTGEKGFCPYLYQGQSIDEEAGLAYNRFRYYDNESGSYLSQDPIGLMGGNPTIYGFVKNTNSWIDVFGLECMQKRLGDFGEKWAKEQLESSGKYKSVFHVQNASNHGIDLVGHRFDGKFDVFEVKTNISGNVGELSARQVNATTFIDDILSPNKAGSGGYGISPNMAKTISNNVGDTRLIDVFVKAGEKNKWYVDKGMISIW